MHTQAYKPKIVPGPKCLRSKCPLNRVYSQNGAVFSPMSVRYGALEMTAIVIVINPFTATTCKISGLKNAYKHV